VSLFVLCLYCKFASKNVCAHVSYVHVETSVVCSEGQVPTVEGNLKLRVAGRRFAEERGGDDAVDVEVRGCWWYVTALAINACSLIV
jgi:hypothetical protein